MNNLINNFFENEKYNNVRLQVLPNGVRYIKDKVQKPNVLYSRFKGLTDEQINVLEKDIETDLFYPYVFPQWYRDFLKTTNGCNLFFGTLCLFGEQTPLVFNEETQVFEKALLERNNPTWMAPFNLRYPNSFKLNAECRKRWLSIGEYYADGTSVEWDYERNKVVAMYAVPKSMPIKEQKRLNVEMFENMICAQWYSFDDFFFNETKRLKIVFQNFNGNWNDWNWDRTLPIGHKDFQK